ncbi:hypothetical protein EV426DRAFT_556690, partial [Tirmania nivea]
MLRIARRRHAALRGLRTPRAPLTTTGPAAPVAPDEFTRLLRRICPDRRLPARLGLAVSGGVDSMALAHLASALLAEPDPPPAIHAFIVDHRARPGSTAEANAVAAFLSTRYGFAVHVLPLDPPHPSLPPLHRCPRSAFETAARQYRWHALSRHCLLRRVSHLLLAHHVDDQAETVVMRMVNGTGYAGMAGMRAIAKPPESRGVRGAVGYLSILRPFLVRGGPDGGGAGAGAGRIGIGKERLIATCQANDIPWWEDPTNTDTSLTRRNAIRHLLGGGSSPPAAAAAAAAATTSTDSRCLPKALSRLSLVNFAWQIHSRVFLEDEHIATRLHSLGRAHLSICTFSGTARLSLPRWPPQDMAADLPALSRALQKLVDLLTPMQRPDARPLRNQAAPAVFFPQTLRSAPRAFTAAGLLWTPEELAAERVRWVLSRQPPCRSVPDPAVGGMEMALSSYPGDDREWRLFDGRFYFRRRWPRECPPHAEHTPLSIRFLKPAEVAAARMSFRELDPAAPQYSRSVLLRSRRRGAPTLAPLMPAQADRLLSNAIKKVPGYARFTVPVAVAAVDSPSAPAGQVVGFPTLGLWKRGVFAEAPPATATTTAAAPPPLDHAAADAFPPPPDHAAAYAFPPPHHAAAEAVPPPPDHAAADAVPPPPDFAAVGAVECVMRGWGEYMGEDIPSAGLGRGWDVEWVNPRAEYGPRRKRRTEWAKTFGEGEGDAE